ncbi:MAG: valine--tRNA ligase [Chlamydiae bacterium]|nr:valine--tRNA ligase [Chlamydiota bacterium]MBI3277493.1 valine--tRNA ligase [Chlamydiota bacterium]
MELSKQYSPKEVENKWYSFWSDEGFFKADKNRGGKPFTIVIPPPNITGILHMGHALNNTLQDIMIRFKRMQGWNALWIPGTDHAGIATQNVVEKMLAKEGKHRRDLGRDVFLDRVWEWREKYGNTIINQLKRLGSSCDWSRLRFTMDEGLSEAVCEVFETLYTKGLIYRGDYIVNWCPRCQTALSDEEVTHQELLGSLYYIAYPIQNSHEFVTVATTRPETLLGDVAVAINPKDERYQTLRSRKVILPILKRVLPVIEDDFVDPKFGTGVVKVTPAHDPNDFLMGLRHKLIPMNVMNGDGRMNERAGEDYEGMDRFECREAILEDLRESGLLKKVVPHQHAVGHCYRCHTVIEPRLSPQWFVKMKPLAEKAILAVEKREIKFHPRRWTKVYLRWMKNIRDWCISRQIWWGHRLPVWYCQYCQEETGKSTVDSRQSTEKNQSKNDGRGRMDEKGVIVAKQRPAKCPTCGSSNLRQDEDVLDTWFSSWLWPFSTLNWPKEDEDRNFYYPTSILMTAQEIIFFWVARMIMAGFEFMGEKPFSHVYIHGTVRDDTGAKMSKSLGNSIDPIEIIDEYGTDALRMSLMMLTAEGQDVFLSKDKFEMGRNFANKIWNASRLLMMTLEGAKVTPLDRKPKDLSLEDRYILGKLHEVIGKVTRSLEKYRFNEATHTLYDFFWHHFCDRYIEVIKPILYGPDSPEKMRTQRVLLTVLETSLRLLHPVMPFITEEIWQNLKAMNFLTDSMSSIMISSWPKAKKSWLDGKASEQVEKKYELVRVGRNLRAEYQIKPGEELKFAIKPANLEDETLIQSQFQDIQRLLKASNLDLDLNYKPQKPMPSGLSLLGTLFMDIEGFFDFAAEEARLRKQLDGIDTEVGRVEGRLSNANFVSRAPLEVVQKEKAKLEDLKLQKEKLQKNLEFVKAQAG